MILRNCEISSVCYQTTQYPVDFEKSVRFTIRSFTVQLTFEIAKSVQFTFRISTVQLILRNCEISSVYYENVQCSVDFAKMGNPEISSVYYLNFHCSVYFAKL